MTRALWLGSLLGALAASGALAGCGEGATSATTTKSTHAPTVAGGRTSVSHTEREPTGERQAAAKPLTLEEMGEYDVNEGRCRKDGGTVRDVGTVGAYCAFPARSDDFHLIESSKATEVSEEE